MRRALCVGTTFVLLGAATSFLAAAAAAASGSVSPLQTVETFDFPDATVKEGFIKNETAATVPAGTDATEAKYDVLYKDQSPPQERKRPPMRGPGFLLVGLVLLGMGMALAYAKRNQRRARGDSLQEALNVLDKLGVSSASNLAIGYMLAGFIEICRSLYRQRQQQQQQQSQGQQGDVTETPRLRGGFLLMLAFGSLMASMAAAGIDFSTLNYNSLLSALAGYVSKAHMGLFAAGGYELLSSVPDAVKTKTEGSPVNAKEPPCNHHGSAETVEEAQEGKAAANPSKQPPGQAEGQEASEGVPSMPK